MDHIHGLQQRWKDDPARVGIQDELRESAGAEVQMGAQQLMRRRSTQGEGQRDRT